MTTRNLLMRVGRTLILALACTLSLATQAAPDLLDTTTIHFSARGSGGSIAGSWNAEPLLIDVGETVEYFVVGVTQIESTHYSKPSSISLSSYIPYNSASLNFCMNSIGCVAEAIVGSTGFADHEYSNFNEMGYWVFLDRLIFHGNPSLFITSGPSILSGLAPVADISVSGQVWVEAYGVALPASTASTVPEPEAFALLGLGLAGLAASRRRKQT